MSTRPRAPRLRAYLRDVFGLDPRSLAVLRIGLGVTLLIDLVIRAGDLARFYSDAGVITRAAVRGHISLPSLHMVSGAWEAQAGLFALAAAFACMLIAGWRTRLAAFASWFLLQSLHARNPFVLNGGDILLRCMLLWAMFLPLGARLSLDARAGRGGARGPVVGAASVGFVAQLAVMYLATAALKSGDAWLDGSALYYALHSDHLAYQPLASWLLQSAPVELVLGEGGLAALRAIGLPIRDGTPWITALLTYATLALEYLGPLLLLWPRRRGPARALLVAAFIGFHVCTDVCLSIGLFALISVVMWTALLPGWLWDQVGWRAAVRPERAPARRRWSIDGALAVLVLILVHWNLRTLDPQGRVVPRVTAAERAVVETLRIHQRWSMFAPTPDKNDGWWRTPARLVGGGEVDLSTGARPAWTPVSRDDGHRPLLSPEDATLELSREKPRDPAAQYPNHRHRKFMNNLRRSRQIALRPRLARYLCQEWNARHEGDERLRELQLIYMLERTPAPGEAAKPVRAMKIWRHACEGVS